MTFRKNMHDGIKVSELEERRYGLKQKTGKKLLVYKQYLETFIKVKKIKLAKLPLIALRQTFTNIKKALANYNSFWAFFNLQNSILCHHFLAHTFFPGPY